MSNGVFHLKYPRMKHEENSPQGDREAVRRGCWASDHDWLKSHDGIVENAHWPDPFKRDRFEDPDGILGVGDKMHEMYHAEIARLVAHTNGEEFHIRTADAGIRHAAKVGLKRVFGEAKPLPPSQRWTVADFRARKRTAKAAGIGLTVMTMDSHKGWRGILWRARLAGCRTRRLHMPGPVA